MSKHKISFPVYILGVIAFLLSGMPKVRIVIGAPIYFVDIAVLAVVMLSMGGRRVRSSRLASSLLGIITAYFVFMVMGEMRGMLVYGSVFDSVYLIFRFSMALSLPFVIPKIVRSFSELRVVIKGLCAGLSLSAMLAILYSLPVTRGLARAVFSIKFICPVTENEAILKALGVLRGQTLIGTSTFSSGVMATLWPLLYMGQTMFRRAASWRYWVWAALALLPIGIMATYGRSAWLSVLLVFASIMLWGGRGRMKAVFVVLVVVVVIVQAGLKSDATRVDIIINKTERTLNTPLEDDNERHRFLAYVDPFKHIVKYPSFLIAGTGVARGKHGGSHYDESKYASHAVPGMAYYCYGVGGAICQIMMMIASLRLCYRRLQYAGRRMPNMVWMWRALLASWFGLLPWWLFGHGIVTQPRGAMVFFMYLGIILACDNIFACEVRKRAESSVN
jgi:hypothetical protein